MDSIQDTMEVYPKFIGILQELCKDPKKGSGGKSIRIQKRFYKQRYGVPYGFYRDSIKNSIWIQRDYKEIYEDVIGILCGFCEEF